MHNNIFFLLVLINNKFMYSAKSTYSPWQLPLNITGNEKLKEKKTGLSLFHFTAYILAFPFNTPSFQDWSVSSGKLWTGEQCVGDNGATSTAGAGDRRKCALWRWQTVRSLVQLLLIMMYFHVRLEWQLDCLKIWCQTIWMYYSQTYKTVNT